MEIKITGINGYIGQLIAKELVAQNHQVSGIKRELLYGSISELQKEICACDVVINLAGAPILKRWTPRKKKLIYDSRISTTKNLVEAIKKLPTKERPKKFITSSAIGIYKNGMVHDESSTMYSDQFVGTVVKDWEEQLLQLPSSIPCTIFRIGLVLGEDAKTISNLRLPFKLGLGGKIGSGKQAFPFIHEKDLANAFVWATENRHENIIFNLVAPQKITNSEFVAAFAKQLNRPAVIPVPVFLIKLVLGEAATLLIESPEVKPKALLEDGFNFEYPTIEIALAEILA